MGNNLTGPFKVCPCCGAVWHDRDGFIGDPSLYLNGYMADFNTLEKGLFYFTHLVDECRSTLAVPAGFFLDLYVGEPFPLKNRGRDNCPGHCQEKEPSGRCEELCEYVFVREVIQLILGMKKSPSQTFEPDVVSLPWQDEGVDFS